jgi:transposase
MVLRAKIVLRCVEEVSVKDTAAMFGVAPATVIFWKKRFRERGIDCLSDKHRSGRPPVYGEDFKQSILKKLREFIPSGDWYAIIRNSRSQFLPLMDNLEFRKLSERW